jgi:hypothetical protein
MKGIRTRGGVEITHADLPVLGASSKVFSIRAKAHAANVQVAVLVRLVIDEDTVLMLMTYQAP